jgi:hypothetical protein
MQPGAIVRKAAENDLVGFRGTAQRFDGGSHGNPGGAISGEAIDAG